MAGTNAGRASRGKGSTTTTPRGRFASTGITISPAGPRRKPTISRPEPRPRESKSTFKTEQPRISGSTASTLLTGALHGTRPLALRCGHWTSPMDRPEWDFSITISTATARPSRAWASALQWLLLARSGGFSREAPQRAPARTGNPSESLDRSLNRCHSK